MILRGSVLVTVSEKNRLLRPCNTIVGRAPCLDGVEVARIPNRVRLYKKVSKCTQNNFVGEKGPVKKTGSRGALPFDDTNLNENAIFNNKLQP
jgi:hypothetical protein